MGSWGSWVHSQWGCRGPLNVPLWALMWDSMKNELEQIMWAIHIIALGLGLSICDMGVGLVSIHLQEVPIIREGVDQSDLTTLGALSIPNATRPDSWPGNLDPTCLS